jgi:protein TonB
MGIIILITAMVLIVSLYDFYTSRSWQQVTSDSRNDVVFDERNKAYGAYQIRRDYDRNLLFILFGIAASLGIVYGAMVYFGSVQKAVKIPPVDPVVTIVEPPKTIEIEMKIEPKKVNPPLGNEKIASSIKNTPPVVVDHTTTTDVPTQDEMKNVNSSTSTNNNPGGEFGSSTKTTSTTGTGGDTNGDTGEVGPIDYAQYEAMFPGGHGAMMEYLSSKIRYPEIALISNIQGRVTLRFVVGKDGSIENVTVAKGVPNCPECDKEAIRVVKAMPKWKPAMHEGKVVRSYFNLPITFRIK